jgi:hypothetical protein
MSPRFLPVVISILLPLTDTQEKNLLSDQSPISKAIYGKTAVVYLRHKSQIKNNNPNALFVKPLKQQPECSFCKAA